MKFKRNLFLCATRALMVLLTLTMSGCSGQESPDGAGADGTAGRILVFSATRGFRHASIAAGRDAFRSLGKANGFGTDFSEDPEQFEPENLRQYQAVVFLNTTGSFFNAAQKEAFQEFIRAGGGFVGVHSAADTFYDWPWYGELVGGYFKSHPEIQPAALHVIRKDHPATAHLPSPWERRDEWYNFKSLGPEIRVLITIDEKSYRGGENGDHHPVSWFHEFEGGRAFYTALGHTRESYTEEPFLQHVLGGLKWVMRQETGTGK